MRIPQKFLFEAFGVAAIELKRRSLSMTEMISAVNALMKAEKWKAQAEDFDWPVNEKDRIRTLKSLYVAMDRHNENPRMKIVPVRTYKFDKETNDIIGLLNKIEGFYWLDETSDFSLEYAPLYLAYVEGRIEEYVKTHASKLKTLKSIGIKTIQGHTEINFRGNMLG